MKKSFNCTAPSAPAALSMVCVSLAVLPNITLAATGFFGDGTGGAIFYTTTGTTIGEGTYRNVTNLGSLDYGDFAVGSTDLLLRGGEIKTFKNSGGDVTGGTLFYRTYYTGESAPAFSSVSLPFESNLGAGGDQRWKTVSANVNLIGSNTVSGNYTTEYYFQLFSNQGNPLLDDSGTLYQTTFDLFYQIDTAGSVTQSAPGGATVLQGNGNFIKKGIGTVEINNANSTYSGSIFLDQGTTSITAGAGLGSGSVTMGPQFSAATATITLADSDGGSILSNNIQVRANGAGSRLGGSNAGGTNSYGGTVTLNGNAVVEAAAGGTVAFSGVISGAGGLTKEGAGTVTLNAANNYNGITQITGGTLLLGIANALHTDSNVSLSGGRLATGTNSSLAGTLTSSGSSVIDLGGGNSALTFNSISSIVGTLQVWNWAGAVGVPNVSSGTRLLFESGSVGTDYANVQFYDGGSGSNLIGSGGRLFTSGGGLELVPVPEPGALLAGLALLAPLAWRERRHWMRCAVARG